MKLCPQCEFIYEDDQSLCDMDGEALVYDTRLGASSGTVPSVTGARPKKSRKRIIVVPVVAGFVLLALLSIVYYASSASLYSSFASRSRKPDAPERSRQQEPSTPLYNSASSPAPGPSQSPTNPQAASQSVSPEVDEVLDAQPFARSQVVVNNIRTRDNSLAIVKGLPPLPQLAPLPRLPPIKRLPAAKPETKLPGSRRLKNRD